MAREHDRPPAVVWSPPPAWAIRWIVAPVLALVLLHAFVLDTFRVDGASMQETLSPGDWLLVSKLGASQLPERGAIVVFRLPQNPSLVLVKRVAGLPGDALESHVVPADHLFVLGDNRTPGASSDSREWGDLPLGSVIGRAVFRLWPPGRFGALR